jgi:hypothetical protein
MAPCPACGSTIGFWPLTRSNFWTSPSSRFGCPQCHTPLRPKEKRRIVVNLIALSFAVASHHFALTHGVGFLVALLIFLGTFTVLYLILPPFIYRFEAFRG